MAGQLKLRRGTTSQLANYIGSEGELTYDTALKSLVLHDGVTLGGVKIPYLSNNLVPSTMLPTATELVVGASKIATTAIAQAGVNDADIITAKKLRDASFGFNQTYKDVTALRSINTVFTNSSPKPIFLAISVGISARTYAYIYCGANEATSEYSYLSSGSSTVTLYAIVNPFEEYRLTGALSITKWRERS